MELIGKVAVVMGGAKGVGRGICHALGDEGATVVIADIDREAAEDVAESLWKRGVKAEAMTCDVTKRTALEGLADRIAMEFGGVDLLCNNASVSSDGDIQSLAENDWDRLMAVNLKAVYFAVAAFVPQMIERGKPHHGIGVGKPCANGASCA